MTVPAVQMPALSVPPRICRTLRGSDLLGMQTVELAYEVGLELDDWQAFSIVESMRTRPDGRWCAFEFGESVPRQNGKGGIIEARLLGALEVVGSNLSIYSSHNFPTAIEHMRRVEELVTESPRLSKQLKGGSRGIKHSHGEEGIEFTGNRRLRFKTRTKGGGRGFSCDGVLMLDEAMFISEFVHGALFPLISGRTMEVPGPQIWYMGSAVDQQIHEDGVVFARVRERGRGQRGEARRLVYIEFSLDPGVDEQGRELGPEALKPEVAADPVSWAQANPALGIRIAEDYIRETEYEAMDIRTFAVERLGIGDWPATDTAEQTVISLTLWARLTDGASRLRDPVCFALDVSPSRGSASIGVAGLRSDGLPHVEVVDQREGTGWIVARCKELQGKHQPLGFVVDERGPAASLIPDLKEAGVKLILVNIGDVTQACSTFFDYCDQEKLRHLGTPELKVALKGAKTRPLGDSWAWARKKSTVDITPLVAVTLALWGTMRERASVYEEREVIAI